MLLALLAASPIALGAGPTGKAIQAGRSARLRPSPPTTPQHGPGVLRLLPPDAVSDKEITLGGRKIAYTATAGTLALFDQSGEKTAAVFYTAYVAKDADAARRPLTFAFNGGPGAASVYLNLGLAGPRIVDFGAGRPRRRGGQARRQSGLLARLHRSGDDRSDRHRLEPHRQARRRQEFLRRAQRRQRARQGDRALRRQEQPQRIAEISAGRELRRLSRRQGCARACSSDQGIVVTGIVMVSPLLEASFQWGGSQYCAGRRAAIPDAGGDRTRADQEIHAGGDGRGRALRNERIPDRRWPARRRPATRPRRFMGASPR